MRRSHGDFLSPSSQQRPDTLIVSSASLSFASCRKRVQRLFIASMTFWLQRRLNDGALKPVAEFKAPFSLSVISMDSNGFSSLAFSESCKKKKKKSPGDIVKRQLSDEREGRTTGWQGLREGVSRQCSWLENLDEVLLLCCCCFLILLQFSQNQQALWIKLQQGFNGMLY